MNLQTRKPTQPLVPCPWCGKSKHLYLVLFCQTWSVQCEPCGIEGPSRPIPVDSENAWSARAGEASIDERLLSLAADLSDAAEDVRNLASRPKS